MSAHYRSPEEQERIDAQWRASVQEAERARTGPFPPPAVPDFRTVGVPCPDCGLMQRDATHDSADDCIHSLRAAYELRGKLLSFVREREAAAQVAREDAERERDQLRRMNATQGATIGDLLDFAGRDGATWDDFDRWRATRPAGGTAEPRP